MSLEKVIFIKTHSNESKKAEEILKKNKVNFLSCVKNSDDEPRLITSSSSGRCSYDGYVKILEYVATLPYS